MCGDGLRRPSALPDSHVKEYLHRAYVSAVVAQAGYTCEFSTADYGVDACISRVRELPGGKFTKDGVHLNVQLKATQNYRQNALEIRYDLDADAHNRLVHHDSGAIVLLLFCMPPMPSDHFDLTEHHLELRHCCYWHPRPTSLTSNTSSVTITIPRSRLFTPDACRELMDQVREGRL